MAEIADAFATPKLKEYNFEVVIQGLPTALTQTCDFGNRKMGIVKTYGGRGHPFKEQGQTEFEDVVLGVCIPAEGPGKDIFEEWANDAYDPALGRARTNHPHRMISITEYDDQKNPIRGWDYYNCLLSAYHLGKRDRANQDKAAIDEIHIAYERRQQRIIG
jgi:phage tail-like protein